MADSKSADSRKVLIVEDDEATRKAVGRAVVAAGFSVTAAASVQEALARLNGQTHILLDLLLPDGTGDQVLQEIRRRGSPARVALTTGAPDDSQRMINAMQLHPDMVFRKPFELQDVTQWLSQQPA